MRSSSRQIQTRRATYQLLALWEQDPLSALHAARVTESHTPPLQTGQRVLVREFLPSGPGLRAHAWEEEAALDQIGRALDGYGLPALSRTASDLVPTVLDTQGRRQEGGVLVMSHPRGQKLSHLLAATPALAEREALSLVYQLLAVMTQLHDDLRRAMLQLNPAQLYWQREEQQLMVIQWNQLSPEWVDEGEPPYAIRNRRAALGLLYRLLVGVDAPGATLVQMAAPEGWARLSPVTQLLLQDLMVGDGGERLTTHELFEEVGRTLELHQMTGDGLVLKVTDIHERIQKLAGDSDPQTDSQRTRLLLQASALLSLAESKGISLRMTSVAQGLRQELEVQTTPFYLDRGLRFLSAGDASTAREFLHQALTTAQTPPERLLAWRWWILARQLPTQQQSGALLPTLEGYISHSTDRPRLLGNAERQQLASLNWPGVEIICREMEIQETLQGLLALRPAEMGQEALQEWLKRSGDALDSPGRGRRKEQLDLSTLCQAEAYQVEGQQYGDAIWQCIGEPFGLADPQEIRRQVQQQRRILQDRIQALDSLARTLRRTPMTPDRAREIVAGKAAALSTNEGVVQSHLLERIPAWLEGTQKDPAAHDDLLDTLCNWLAQQRLSAEELRQLQEIRHHFALLQEAQWQLKRLAHPNPDSEKLLDQTLTLLSEIQERTVYAPNRRQKLVKTFVERCLTHSHTSPLIEAWLDKRYPDQKKFLLDGLDYQSEIDEKRQELTALKGRLKEEQAAFQAKLKTAQKAQDKKLAQERKEHEAQLADLEKRLTELQSQLEGLDAHYQQETTRREAALKRQLAEKQQQLDGLAARYDAKEQEMEQRLDHLKQGVQTKQGEKSALESQVNELTSQKNRLESDLRTLNSQAASVRANRAAYEEQAQAAEQKLKTSRESARNMDQVLERLAREVKDLEQERERLQAQVAQARQSVARDPDANRQDDAVPTDTQPHGSGIVSKDTRHAQSAQPLFPPSSKPAQTTQVVQSEAIRHVNKLLAAAESIGIGPGDKTFAERLAGKLRRDAETEQRSMQGAMQAYSTALTKVENLGHLYRVLAYLASTHNTPPVLQDMYAVQSIWDEARSEFRKHWGRDQ